MTRYLEILTEIQPLREDGTWRDERTRPEKRRQVVAAMDRAAADRIAAAFKAFGMVRAGRQRVKIIRVDRSEPQWLESGAARDRQAVR